MKMNNETDNTPSGILIVNKPHGMTSHDVVGKIRKLYGTRQVGHTGTLDPMATGVLAVLVGRAVKASEYAVEHDKTYLAGLKLGITTDTEDIEGNVLSRSESIPDAESVFDILGKFRGNIMQVPPMYSALKRDGQKLCDLARKGVSIEREARPVTVFSLCAETTDEKNGEYLLTVSCSRGTYIRTLCADIGAALGCGAVMSSLSRTRVGNFDIADAVSLDALEQMPLSERFGLLHDTESLFSDLPIIKLSDFFSRLALSGNEIYLKKIGVDLPVGSRVRLYDSSFFSLGEVRDFPDGRAVKPVKKFRL